jgi:hypothetical protein
VYYLLLLDLVHLLPADMNLLLLILLLFHYQYLHLLML